MDIAVRYPFIIAGPVSDAAAAEMPEMASTPFPTDGTALFRPVRDEADVMTMHARICSLGVSIIEMRRLPD